MSGIVIRVVRLLNLHELCRELCRLFSKFNLC